MSVEVLTQWRTLLTDIGELGGALCGAIEGDDVLGAIAAMMQLRRTRAELARVEAPIALRGDREEIEAMAHASSLTVNARAAEGAMQRWLGRELPGDARLLSSPLGVAALADAILPVVWDFEADVVALVGADMVPVAELLIGLGQRRIVILDGGDAIPPDVIKVASVDEASLAVRMMIPGPPTRMV